MYRYIYIPLVGFTLLEPLCKLPLISSFQTNSEVEVGENDCENHSETLPSSAGLENSTGLPVGRMRRMGVGFRCCGTVIKREWWIFLVICSRYLYVSDICQYILLHLVISTVPVIVNY